MMIQSSLSEFGFWYIISVNYTDCYLPGDELLITFAHTYVHTNTCGQDFSEKNELCEFKCLF